MIAARSSGLDLLTRRWAAQTILALNQVEEPIRFNALMARLEVSDRQLSIVLRELEGLGLVRRDVEAGPPVVVSYSLTREAIPYVAPLEELAEL